MGALHRAAKCAQGRRVQKLAEDWETKTSTFVKNHLRKVSIDIWVNVKLPFPDSSDAHGEVGKLPHPRQAHPTFPLLVQAAFPFGEC